MSKLLNFQIRKMHHHHFCYLKTMPNPRCKDPVWCLQKKNDYKTILFWKVRIFDWIWVFRLLSFRVQTQTTWRMQVYKWEEPTKNLPSFINFRCQVMCMTWFLNIETGFNAISKHSHFSTLATSGRVQKDVLLPITMFD